MRPGEVNASQAYEKTENHQKPGDIHTSEVLLHDLFLSFAVQQSLVTGYQSKNRKYISLSKISSP